MTRPIRILLQTTIPPIADDWSIAHTQDCVFIQLTLNAGRTVEHKKGFEVAKENSSFGNGDVPYES